MERKTVKTVKAKATNRVQPVNVKVVGYYSTMTKRTYTRKADRKRAENKLIDKQNQNEYNNKLNQLKNKYNG